MWVRSRQFTGRIATVSNSRILSKPVCNYTRGFPFIWQEMAIPITWQADRSRAEAVLLDAACRHGIDPASIAADAKRHREQVYRVGPIDLESRLSWRITDNWLELTLRFITHPHGVRGVKDAMSRVVPKGLHAARIHIASGTYDIVGLPRISLREPASEGRPA